MFKDILVTGITTLEEYPNMQCKKYCKQCIDSNILCIPNQKPDIESINEIKVGMCVDNINIIDTILGPKLIINGMRNIKIIYTANNCEQSLHSSHWCEPFCEYILLEEYNYKDIMHSVNGVFVGVEHVCIENFENRYIQVCLIYILCPLIKDEYSCACINMNVNSSVGTCIDKRNNDKFDFPNIEKQIKHLKNDILLNNNEIETVRLDELSDTNYIHNDSNERKLQKNNVEIFPY